MLGTLIVVCGRCGCDPGEMLEALDAREAGFLVACTSDSPRAIPAPEVAAAADALGIVAESVPDVGEAVCAASPSALAGPDDLSSSPAPLRRGPRPRPAPPEVDA
ncbi:MAG: hypothetical protein R2711_08975 [Acidimicrobiales bacterium]